MFSSLSRSVIVGSWMALLAVIIMASIAGRASVSTTVLLLGLGIAPAIVAMLIVRGTSSTTVAEIIYATETKGGRS